MRNYERVQTMDHQYRPRNQPNRPSTTLSRFFGTGFRHARGWQQPFTARQGFRGGAATAKAKPSHHIHLTSWQQNLVALEHVQAF